ncbi:MAG: hypothetical protein MJ126_05555 [Lachnospiraceae bacterium]|nr:hypothetical protein [Lachnospiraceae bacterium]
MLDIDKIKSEVESDKKVVYDPYELLAVSIVSRVADDYRKALKDFDKDEIKECEDFFKSSFCDTLLCLSEMNGAYIMNKIQSEVANECSY